MNDVVAIQTIPIINTLRQKREEIKSHILILHTFSLVIQANEYLFIKALSISFNEDKNNFLLPEEINKNKKINIKFSFIKNDSILIT